MRLKEAKPKGHHRSLNVREFKCAANIHLFTYKKKLWVCKPMKPGIKFGQHFKASIRHPGRDNIHISWNCLLSCQEFSYRAHEIKQTDVNNFSVTLFSFPFPQWASLVTQRSRGPWVWKIPWGRTGKPLQYSCVGNPMDRGTLWAIVHGVGKESDMT